jgi:hypothetical protein
MKKIPILLITNDRPYLLEKVLNRLVKFTPWENHELWILCNYVGSSTKKIVNAYMNKYNFIKAYYQNFNQISIIQNNVINQLKADIYIKIDDDIFVTENWTSAFVDIIHRYRNISIGSVVIPINGFGWIPFLEIMRLKQDFINKFPKIQLIQGCMEPEVWNNFQVNDYLWSNTFDLDSTAKRFISNQNNNYIDYEVYYRYSIGAISFTHEFWEKMGGWKVDPNFYKKYKIWEKLNKALLTYKKISGKEELKRLPKIVDLMAGINKSALGIEEEYVFNFSQEKGYKQMVTTQNIVFHFSFYTCEEYLMNKYYL